jgi:hypothetical protein
VNFSKVSGALPNKARNISVRVSLVDSDAVAPLTVPTGERVIFSGGPPHVLTTFINTPVVHHNKAPDFYSEVKLALPTNLTSRHHLFFAFYHVAVDSKKAGGADLIGYAFQPLLAPDGQSLAVETLEVVDLPIASAAVKYGDALLPANYAQTSSAAASSDLKFIDGGSKLFTVALRLQSSIYPADKDLRNFFVLCATLERSPQSDIPLVACIKSLHGVPKHTMFGRCFDFVFVFKK